ncbi:MAG: cadmium-translocating P-type ATPase [Oscillospiraceae bacterium]|nr:cadmium-translocating P-type ATPase [Oscillospiraceae bacterium]
MSKKQKKSLLRIILSAVLLIAAAVFEHIAEPSWYIALPIFLVPYIIIGYDVLVKSVKNIAHGQVFDENFLMAIATIGAIATGQYPEAVFVMLFYQVGEFFQNWAVGKSRQSISELMDIRPDYANLIKDGEITTVDPYDVVIGDIILIKPGEKIPLDGEIIEGSSSFDTSALTGESLPRDVGVSDKATSGCVNLSGVIKVKVTSEFGESTVNKILELIEESSSNKAASEDFITKFAKYYTPIVVFCALALAIIPTIFTGEFKMWLMRALTFLVISCPCALVISIPLSFFGGIGGASRKGILIKGSCYLENLSKAEIAVFDKTGTLTEGTFSVTAVHPTDISEEELIEYAAYAEYFSEHPIACSVKSFYGKEIDKSKIHDVKEFAGHGIEAEIGEHKILAGNKKLCEMHGIEADDCEQTGTILHICIDWKYAGHIVISDKIKENSAKMITELKNNGVKNVMLTGDRDAVGKDVANTLGIDEVHTELLPTDKVNIVEELITKKSKNGKLLFSGDGINDAPVLARADIGIAMGGIGSDASIEAADIVIMDDDIGKIGTALKLSKRTLKIVKENIAFALGIKISFLILGAFGITTMWMAVFADVGVSVIAILNSMRTLREKN